MINHFRKQPLLYLTLLGLILRLLYAVLIYDSSLLLYHGGDYTLYEIGASEVLEGDFTFSNSLYLVRTPLFPLLVALLNLNPILILGVNILLGTVLIPLTYLLAREIQLPVNLALVASFIIALDPTSIRFSGVLLAEPLANFFVLLFFIALWRFIKTQQYHYQWAFASAILLNLASLSRPSSYLIWIPATLCLLFAPKKSYFAIVVFIVTSIFGTSLWQYHNAVYFDNSSYTTIGTYNLLYYRAASVEYQSSDASITDVYADLARQVESAIGNDISTVTADTRNNHVASTTDTQTAMTSIAIDIFLEHPLIYLLTLPIGIGRVFITTQTFPMIEPIVMVWNFLFLLMSLLGIFGLLRDKKWDIGVFLLVISAYYIAGTLLVQTSGIDTRARSMITPLMVISTIYFLQYYKPFEYIKRNLMKSGS